MVTFSHTDTGTPESAWAASGVPSLPELPLDANELASMTFVVLAAHPDDESLGAGGLVAKVQSAGATVHFLLCTAGEASHPESRTTTPERLAAVRLSEFHTAVSGLAPGAAWRFLELPDGRLAASRERIAKALQETITESGAPAGNVVIVAPYRSDGHTDHDALGSIAAQVAAAGGHGLLEYPVWYWLWAPPEDSTWCSWVRVPLTEDEQAAKAKAMRAHVSQTHPLSPEPGDGTLLSATFLEHFSRPWETFAWRPPVTGTNAAADAERIFDEVHARADDPWNYTTSWYERRKRTLTLAALPREEYVRGLEVGCSIGTLSVELTGRCRELTAVDASSTAATRARNRLAAVDGAEARQMTVPAEWPEGAFDLVVVSEVGYYLAPDELGRLFHRISESLDPGGTLLLCHWRHPIVGWQLDGEAVHTMARGHLGWPVHGTYHEKDFILEVFTAPGGPA
ncbi:PIG-L family deacetylase [Paenarthrobacter sp. NCHU4564]|uniref:PIG-L family deacetylase n=1 Tax=Paenarthrobacter sp. NCHU4564 TaxID=3451353 RepID=UPI003F9CEC26